MRAVEDAAPYYAAADAFALPTWYDSCSLVVLEALASGLPVITTTHNGASELMTGDLEPFVMRDPGDVEQLSDAVRTLFDRDVHDRVSRTSRRIAERYPVEANYRQVMALGSRRREECGTRPSLPF